MRSLTLWLPVCLVLFALLGAGLVIADEPPAPPVKPNEKEEPAEPAATDEDAGAEEATTPALDPKQGYVEMTKVVQGLPRGQWSQARKDAATKWLAKWSAGEQTATGEELLYLGRLQQTAEQYTASAKSFQGVVGDAEVLEGIRAQAVGGLAGLLARKVARDHLLSDGVCQSCLESVTGYLTSASDPKTASMRAGTHRTLAGYYSSMKDSEAAVGHHMQAAVLNPSLASASARSVLRDLMGSTHSMDGYKPLRAGANAVLSALAALAQQNLQKAKENLAELKESNADKRRIQQAERNLRSAESAVKLKDRYGKPFELLGTEAPQWTLEHAFGDLQALDQLKGKVVVLDFWATWCPWCIKSFPAIRDVLKDYDGKDLVFVGVTASSSSVYEARYDLDDDLKDKGEAGQRARPVARMVRGTQEPNPEGGIYSTEEYKAKEKEAITTFIANHEMNWPVVMIDKTEPGPKYALMGWPHAVVIDKEGRIRYFKSGALLRDRPEDVKNFRAILDDLLAEPAAK